MGKEKCFTEIVNLTELLGPYSKYFLDLVFWFPRC